MKNGEWRMKLRNLTFYILHFAFYISMAQTAPWDGLRGGVHVVTNEQDAVAMAEIARATNGIPAQIAAATNDIPEKIAAATNGIPEKIAAATNGLPERIDAVTNRLSAYALKTQIPDMPDLSPYALKSEVPPAPDLTGYATKYEVALATNGVPARIATATNGLPEKIVAATNALHASLAPTIAAASTALQPAATNGIPETLAIQSETLEMQSSEIARLSQSITASQTSNTAYRLMSPDGGIYQDATGTVWHTTTAIGTSQWHVVSITYTNGTTVATNEIPGIPSWSIDGSWNESEGVDYWIWSLRVPDGGNEYASYGGAEETSPADMSLQFPLGSGEISHLNFARTNTVSHYWAPVDHVLYSSSGGGGGGITTNDVCNIVTNVVTTDEWIYTGLPDGAIIHYPPEYMGDEWWNCVMSYNGDNYDGSWDGPEDSTFMTFRFVNVTTPDGEDYIVSAEHRFTVRNALGLARLADLPPLTNGLATAASVSAANTRATDAQTMAAAASNYTARVDAELSAISNRAPAVVDTILGVSWVLKATNGVIYAEVEQQ